jgi:glutamyl/glutaminyl-tRNA synthetase
MAIRVGITGRTATPPLFDVMVAIGYETTIARLGAAAALAARVAGEE